MQTIHKSPVRFRRVKKSKHKRAILLNKLEAYRILQWKLAWIY